MKEEMREALEKEFYFVGLRKCLQFTDYIHSGHQAMCTKIQGKSRSKKGFCRMLSWTVKAFEGDKFPQCSGPTYP